MNFLSHSANNYTINYNSNNDLHLSHKLDADSQTKRSPFLIIFLTPLCNNKPSRKGLETGKWRSLLLLAQRSTRRCWKRRCGGMLIKFFHSFFIFHSNHLYFWCVQSHFSPPWWCAGAEMAANEFKTLCHKTQVRLRPGSANRNASR